MGFGGLAPIGVLWQSHWSVAELAETDEVFVVVLICFAVPILMLHNRILIMQTLCNKTR